MPNILTTDFMSESTEELIKKSQQILGGIPMQQAYRRRLTMLDTTMSLPTVQVRTLAPACNRIEVKNVVTITDASIVICTGSATGTCGAIPGTCPSVSPNDYINMVATVDALVAENNVEITFEYLLDEVPTTTVVTANLAAGTNTVYAFSTNTQYAPSTTLTLFGARVTRY